MKRFLSLILLGFFAFIMDSTFVPGPVRASTLVASNAPTPDFTIYGVGLPGSSAIAQSFTATQGGSIESIELRFAANGPTPSSIEIDLYSTGVGGIPAGPLGTAVISAPTLTSSLAWISADFTSLGISLTSGGIYAIRARPGSVGGFFVGGSTIDTYATGQAWSSTDGGSSWSGSANAEYDLSFRVYVPEPTTSLLVGLGLVFMATGRRQRA